PLGMDSTIVYDFTNGNPQNMRSIRQSDLERNSKYNTRRFLGLPPSAIGNPGKLAIQAALNPDKTDFLYFVADGTGGHVFSKTLKEHNRNVANWRKIENKRKKSDN
ncbi:MAG: endolytic transglycosylase MltG, partial [Amylibacter sp.]